MPEPRRLLVVSDSHGNYIKLNRIIEEAGAFDFLVHCGDGAGDLVHVSLPEGVRFLRIAGNVDVMRMPDLCREDSFRLNGKHFFITHGDVYGVKSGTSAILREGTRQNADIVLFGHTHQQYIKDSEPLLFNPGASNRGMYGIVEIDEAGGINLSHFLLEDGDA